MKGVFVILKNPKIINRELNENGFYVFIFRFKLYVENKVKKLLKEPHASFLNGLLFGSKKGMPEDVLNDFKTTGLTHIIAISGYNITIIIIIVLACLSFLPRKIQLIVAGLFIVLFTIFVGAEASVVRASLMGVLSLMALYSGRSQDITHILIMVASIMIVINYRVLVFDVGFQLSFMATAGLVYISPMIEKYFDWLPDFFSIRESFLLTMSAQITALPIILYHFGNLSVVSPFANVLVAPFLPVAMLFGFLSFMIGVISMKLGVFIGFFAYLSLDVVLKVAYYLSRIDFASFEVPKFSIVFLFLYYLILYLFFKKSLDKV
jgi:competence protein ComEC